MGSLQLFVPRKLINANVVIIGKNFHFIRIKLLTNLFFLVCVRLHNFLSYLYNFVIEFTLPAFCILIIGHADTRDVLELPRQMVYTTVVQHIGYIRKGILL